MKKWIFLLVIKIPKTFLFGNYGASNRATMKRPLRRTLQRTNQY
jgi:hypothetical protein